MLAFVEGAVLFLLVIRWFTSTLVVTVPVINSGLYEMRYTGLSDVEGQEGGECNDMQQCEYSECV